MATFFPAHSAGIFLDKMQWIAEIPIEIVLNYSKKRWSLLNNTNMLHLRPKKRTGKWEKKKKNKQK